MSAPLPAPLPPLAMPPPSAPAAAPPRAPMPASFAALTIFSFLVRSGPLMSPATRLHSATTDWGGTPLDVDAVGADGVGVADGAVEVGACATLGLSEVEGDADGATTFVSVGAVRFATTIPVTTATTAAMTSPIDVIFHMFVLSSAMAVSSLRHGQQQCPCQRLLHARGLSARRRCRRQRHGTAHDQHRQWLGSIAQGQLVTRQAVGGPTCAAG